MGTLPTDRSAFPDVAPAIDCEVVTDVPPPSSAVGGSNQVQSSRTGSRRGIPEGIHPVMMNGDVPERSHLVHVPVVGAGGGPVAAGLDRERQSRRLGDLRRSDGRSRGPFRQGGKIRTGQTSGAGPGGTAHQGDRGEAKPEHSKQVTTTQLPVFTDFRIIFELLIHATCSMPRISGSTSDQPLSPLSIGRDSTPTPV